MIVHVCFIPGNAREKQIGLNKLYEKFMPVNILHMFSLKNKVYYFLKNQARSGWVHTPIGHGFDFISIDYKLFRTGMQVKVT